MQALQAVGVSGLPSGGGGDASVSTDDMVALSEAAQELQTVSGLLGSASGGGGGTPFPGSLVSVVG